MYSPNPFDTFFISRCSMQNTPRLRQGYAGQAGATASERSSEGAKTERGM
jgi:hypothetical protein